MKVTSLVTLFLLFCGVCHATSIGMEVQSWVYDARTHDLTVKVVNMSHKDVSAFSIMQTTFYTDGTSNTSQMTTDYLPQIISLEQSGASTQQGNGALPPGAEEALVTLETKAVDKVIAVVQLVVYTDNTADVVNRQEYGALMAMRKGEALGFQRANELIINTLNSNDPHPVATIGKKLSEWQGEAKNPNNLARDNPEIWVSKAYGIVQSDLSRVGQKGQADELRAMVQRHAFRASEMLNHAEVHP